MRAARTVSRHVILRYFNVAGADPHGRTGQSSKGATHLIKVAVETALGLRPKLDVFGTDYPTPDGTCIRDYIHVSDLVRAHSDALRHLRSGAPSLTLNCGYGHGFSVLEVIEAVKRVSGVDFKVDIAPRRAGRSRRRSWPQSARIRRTLGWRPRFDELSTIVAHALAWERELIDAGLRRRSSRESAPAGPTATRAVVAPLKSLENSGPSGHGTPRQAGLRARPQRGEMDHA